MSQQRPVLPERLPERLPELLPEPLPEPLPLYGLPSSHEFYPDEQLVPRQQIRPSHRTTFSVASARPESPHTDVINNSILTRALTQLSSDEAKANTNSAETKTSPSEVDQGIICPYCQNVLECPMVAPCGHSVCYKCVYEAKFVCNVPSGENCPVCRKVSSFGMYHKNYSLGKAVESIVGKPMKTYSQIEKEYNIPITPHLGPHLQGPQLKKLKDIVDKIQTQIIIDDIDNVIGNALLLNQNCLLMELDMLRYSVTNWEDVKKNLAQRKMSCHVGRKCESPFKPFVCVSWE